MLSYAVRCPRRDSCRGGSRLLQIRKIHQREGAELARRAGEQTPRDPVRNVKGKVKKTKMELRARLRRRAVVTSCEGTNIAGHLRQEVYKEV